MSDFKRTQDIEKYILSETGKKVKVSKTNRLISVYYVNDGEIAVQKIQLPGRVLYCLHKDDLQVVIDNLSKEAF